MSDMDEKAATALRKPFPKESVGHLPKGGTMLEYVGHAAVTDRLLTVDPEWSWEPFALADDGLPALDRAGNLWIRLTVCGVTRIGVGDGKSAKECIGDAIRNAAMRFGVALDLWAKENLVEFAQAAQAHQRPAPATTSNTAEADLRTRTELTEGTRKAATTANGSAVLLDPNSNLSKAMHAAMGKAATVPVGRDERLAWVSNILGREITSSKDMTEDEARRILGHINASEQVPA